jgi:hypothetical protein
MSVTYQRCIRAHPFESRKTDISVKSALKQHDPLRISALNVTYIRAVYVVTDEDGCAGSSPAAAGSLHTKMPESGINLYTPQSHTPAESCFTHNCGSFVQASHILLPIGTNINSWQASKQASKGSRYLCDTGSQVITW